MKAMKMITDPEAFQLLADQTRRKMVFLLRVKDMTVSQIAAELNLTPQAVYHHIKKLQKADLVEVAREERVGHLIESYYRATAESFYLSMGKTSGSSSSRKVAIEQVKMALDNMLKLGFKLDYTDEQAAKLVDLRSKMEDEAKVKKLEETISSCCKDVDFGTSLLLTEFAETLQTTDAEFKNKVEASRKLRELLFSLVKK
jgi:DNA-binding transcriptional ArsR family regulator